MPSFLLYFQSRYTLEHETVAVAPQSGMVLYIHVCRYKSSQDLFTLGATSEQEDGSFVDIKIQEPRSVMCHERSEVTSNDTMPRRLQHNNRNARAQTTRTWR